jgi:hypothetical protein
MSTKIGERQLSQFYAQLIVDLTHVLMHKRSIQRNETTIKVDIFCTLCVLWRVSNVDSYVPNVESSAGNGKTRHKVTDKGLI